MHADGGDQPLHGGVGKREKADDHAPVAVLLMRLFADVLQA